MAGISFNQARRVCLSYFYRTPKPAIASTILGLLGGIYSIFLRNDTYLKAASLDSRFLCSGIFYKKQEKNGYTFWSAPLQYIKSFRS